MTTLDEIAARADVIDRCLRANPNDCYDMGDLGDAAIAAREDVPVLVAALRAVEAACQDSEMASVRSFARTFDGALFDAMLSTREIRAAIREALGE